MYKKQDIKAVHVEMSERCNLACLMCDRNMNGGEVNPYLKDRDLTLDTLKKAFTPEFCMQLNRVYFCGNFGDPILAPDLLSILQYLKDQNSKMKTSIITNGCSKPTFWWHELAKVTNSVRFGIDGLADTHKIYRQNAIFHLILRNAKAYIDAGGYAIWDYLVFEHNEHQIDEARDLSKQLGFAEFVVKKTGRFFSNIKLEGKDEHEGLKKPSDNMVNKSLKKGREIKEKYGSMENYLNQGEVDCKVLRNKEIYISAEGIVLPCCWLAGQMYKWYLPEKSSDIWNIVDTETHNIHNHTLDEIFESNIMEQIKKSWSKSSIEDGKMKTCALKCGKELDQFGDQYK